MADGKLERASGEYEVFYLHRQGAREAGVGMMVGPPILAAVAIVFAWRCFWPNGGIQGFGDIMDAVLLSVLFTGFGLLACAFFVAGLRRIRYGGAWGCVIDPTFLTWTYPERSRGEGRSVALRDIRRMEIVCPRQPDNGAFGYFIVTDTEKLPIHEECFGRFVPFVRGLLEANPGIDVAIIEGCVKLWPKMRSEIETLCLAARGRRGAWDGEKS